MNSFNFIIRDGLKSDVTACTELDLAYETDHVWQMTIHRAGDQHNVMFQTTRLPRLMSVDPPKENYHFRLSAPQQCFLVAVGRDEPQMLGYLIMHQDP